MGYLELLAYVATNPEQLIGAILTGVIVRAYLALVYRGVK